MEPVDTPGRLVAAEIAEQPAAWRALLARRAEIASVARHITRYQPRFVLFAARGTSDHAALYGKYLVEIRHGLPAGLVSPSVVTVYGAQPKLAGGLLIAVSQSGGSPDLVRTVVAARDGGALTLAVTNNPASPLAAAAALHVDVAAGPERAVAATKSYTAQLLALYLLTELWRGGDGAAAAQMPALAEAVLGQAAAAMADAAAHFQSAQRFVVTGRGYAYPTAREAALKLMETSYLPAQAFSGADLQHGPMAMLDRSVSVLAVAPAGAAGAAMADVLPRVRQTGAGLFVVGDPAAVSHGTAGFALPPDTPEPLSPLLEILPLQLLALRLALLRGNDPDRPRGLSKVTQTL